MLKKVMTVCGPIEPALLGFTSMHEHILADCSMFRNRARKEYVFPGRPAMMITPLQNEHIDRTGCAC